MAVSLLGLHNGDHNLGVSIAEIGCGHRKLALMKAVERGRGNDGALRALASPMVHSPRRAQPPPASAEKVSHFVGAETVKHRHGDTLSDEGEIKALSGLSPHQI